MSASASPRYADLLARLDVAAGTLGVEMGLDRVRRRAGAPRRSAAPVPDRPDRRHQRQGLDGGDGRGDPAAGRAAHRALHVAAPGPLHGADPGQRARGRRRSAGCPGPAGPGRGRAPHVLRDRDRARLSGVRRSGRRRRRAGDGSRRAPGRGDLLRAAGHRHHVDRDRSHGLSGPHRRRHRAREGRHPQARRTLLRGARLGRGRGGDPRARGGGRRAAALAGRGLFGARRARRRWPARTRRTTRRSRSRWREAVAARLARPLDGADDRRGAGGRALAGASRTSGGRPVGRLRAQRAGRPRAGGRAGGDVGRAAR